jgi:hypothetical protein
MLILAGAPAPAHPADVLTASYDNARTGANLKETSLNTSNVAPAQFGKLWTLYADGQVVAQPLYVSGLRVDTTSNPGIPPVTGTFNAVVIATMHNTVYVYDADKENPGPDGRTIPLWARWLGQPRPGGGDIDMWATNDPEWGILSTPVIDEAKTTLYVVAWHDDGGDRNYRYRLHALNLKDGTNAVAPIVINESRTQKQRAGLLLSGGVLYVAFGGDGSRGLVLAYDAATLQPRAAWSSTTPPAGRNGGIWQAGQGPAADAQGHVYLITGNGTFTAHQHGQDYGNSFVKLKLENGALVVKDFFTPCNERFLDSIDLDLGSAGPLLVPGSDLIVGGGKEGRLYLLSRTGMGKHVAPPQPNAPTCPNPNVLQEFKGTACDRKCHIHGSPVFWRGPDTSRVYVWGEHDRLKSYTFSGGRFQQTNTPKVGTVPLPDGMPGGMLSLSSDGSKAGTGIVWAVIPLDGDANTERGVKGALLAFDAQNVSRTLWTSEQSGDRDRAGLFARFTPPTVAGGKVFVATYGDAEQKRKYGEERPRQFPARYQVTVYGLLKGHAHPPTVVNQDRPDITVVRAAAEEPVAVDSARCTVDTAGTVDCTRELERVHGAPSLHRLVVPTGHAFPGCRVLRLVTASQQAALTGASDVGFYSADATEGQQTADRGRVIAKPELKVVGPATLRNGQPAILHEFIGTVNCTLGPATVSRKIFKPFMDFKVEAENKVVRNWDTSANYTISQEASRFDRSGEVLR